MADITPFQSRSWNGTPIHRRITDGYVNATAMAKASGKEWAGYFRTDRATMYMEALSRNCKIAVTSLYISKPGEGTWIHPRLAVDFARWINADFAVWMDAWFMEELEARASQVRDTQPPPPPVPLPVEVMLTSLERVVDLMDRLGGLDERDQLLFKDLTRNTILRAAGHVGMLPAAPAEEEELAISDAWLQVTGSAMPREKYQPVGRLLAALYKDEHGVKPPKRMQFVDGAPREVNSYKRGWLLNAISQIWAQLQKD